MKRQIIAASVAIIMLPQSAAAQVASDPWGEQRGEAQAQIAFTVPLGHSSRAEETDPRIELMVRQQASSREFAALRRADDARWEERRIGLSLGDNPRMMFNGRAMVREERKDGVSDGVLIGGGVVVALGVLVLFWMDALDDSSA